ncbi:NAD(P)/FAD-dependent oxidoreductase [Rhizobium tumorigenes]|uniref:NAD(P)/FAD-dependent oxidoreductase n=1 Tax=Rhizobium tumorigenes TaxID=2041385 RepID=UPI00241C052A|nr:FAD-dependent oxidoreductase [Rhizobium tumorigenes]WFS01707.1 FAD-dependent oxidoreductase [Rhizobium tumorigenes]
MPTDLQMNITEQSALVTGRAPWGRLALHPWYSPLRESLSVDVAIVGGGITGSLIAEHLTARGYSVCVIDREAPGLGSTSASTAMLMWELDTSLSDLSLSYGYDKAAAIYRRSVVAVSGLGKLIERLQIPCGYRQRSSLYLTNSIGGARELQQELALRKRAGLPGEYLSHPYLMTEFEIERDGAILSPGAAEVDPLMLAWGLLAVAVKRGAQLVNASATRIRTEGRSAIIETDGNHVIEARNVVLATGYAMPGIPMPKLHRATSSWAMATVPQDPNRLWRDRALIWEDSHPYLYMRTSADNRIIIGGEDDATVLPALRDAKMADKIDTLSEKLKRLWPQADTTAEYRWCGTFGETVDGLPLIGPVPDMPNVLAAYGYGGNGITFSFMASLMIGALVADERRDWFDDFALDREGPTYRGFANGTPVPERGLPL